MATITHRITWQFSEDEPRKHCDKHGLEHGYDAIIIDCGEHPVTIALAELETVDGEYVDGDAIIDEDGTVDFETKAPYEEVEDRLMKRHGLSRRNVQIISD